MLPGCLEIGLSVSLLKFIAHIVGGYQNEQPLTNFWNLVRTHILNMNIILKKQLCIFPLHLADICRFL